MEDIIHITYGDLDNKTILENIDGKLEVQTDETIGRTASGALTVIQGGVDITMKEDKGVVSRVVRLLTTEDLNTIVGETIHCRQADSNNIVSGMNYPVMEAGYLECMYSGADNCTHQRYTTYMTDIIFTRRFTTANGWSAWKEIGTGGGLGELASGGNIDGDVYVRGQVHSIKNVGDSYIGVEDETNTNSMFMSLNDTHMTLYQSNDTNEGVLARVDRALGHVESDYFLGKLGDKATGDIIIDTLGTHKSFSIHDSTDPEVDGMNFYMNAEFMGINGSVNGEYITPFYISRLDNVVGSNHFVTKGFVSDDVMILTTEHLNDIPINLTRHYRQPSASPATIANGYPVDNCAGYLEVLYTDANSGCNQRFTHYLTNDVYVRNYQWSPGWSAWKKSSTVLVYEVEEYNIQNEIVELEIKYDKAITKGYTGLANEIQLQIDALNVKLAEVINND